MQDENGLVLGHQVLTDHWPMLASQCTKEDGEFVPASSWTSIQHERQENASLVHHLGNRPTWELTSALLGASLLAGYLWALLDRKMLKRR